MPDSPQSDSRPVVFLHIGLPKSGTTYLQNLLIANRAHLVDNGINFPGRRWRQQVNAVNDLLDHTPGEKPTPRWDAMARSMVEHPGVSLLSMEFLVRATEKHVAYVMKTLEGAEVHVVLTIRDVVSTAPSGWQTSVRSGSDLTWRQYTRTMPLASRVSAAWGRRSKLRGLRHFARTQGVPWIMDTWLKFIPPERFHVVIVPTSRTQPDLLWHRFAEAMGVDPAICTEPPAFSRPSLGYASATLVARVNKRLRRRRRGAAAYRSTMRAYLSGIVLTERSGAESKIPLTRSVYRAGLRLNATHREHLLARGVNVVGDLAELPTELDRERLASLPRKPPSPDQDEVLAAAEFAVRGLDARLREQRGKVAPNAEPIGSWPERPELIAKWRSASDPADAAIRDVLALARKSMRARTAGGNSASDSDGESDDTDYAEGD